MYSLFTTVRSLYPIQFQGVHRFIPGIRIISFKPIQPQFLRDTHLLYNRITIDYLSNETYIFQASNLGIYKLTVY